MNRTQTLLVVFLAMAWLTLLALLIAAPDTFDVVLRLSSSLRLVALAAIACLVAVAVAGVVRRWRWTFWLLLVANLAGGLRVIASALQLLMMLPLMGPAWYVALQAFIGVIQFALGLLMLTEWRRDGVWGRAPDAMRRTR